MQDEEQRRSLNRRFQKLEEERSAKRHLEKSPLRRRFKTPSPSLCRALFGRSGKSDREESINQARAHLRQLAIDQEKRWNFDFESETPLPGRWQWEKVEQPNPADSREASMTVPKPTLPLRPRQANANPPSCNPSAAIQLRITDFLKQRRGGSATFDSKSDQLKMDVGESYDSAFAKKNSKTEA